MTPIRLRLSRKAGFRLQAVSRAANGLPAVSVARPGSWGNPYCAPKDGTAAECVAKFKALVASDMSWLAHIKDIRGANLACWCALDAPCHADVLLQSANGW